MSTTSLDKSLRQTDENIEKEICLQNLNERIINGIKLVFPSNLNKRIL
jgi:hypothetical protein